jgi:hypothetical protein
MLSLDNINGSLWIGAVQHSSWESITVMDNRGTKSPRNGPQVRTRQRTQGLSCRIKCVVIHPLKWAVSPWTQDGLDLSLIDQEMDMDGCCCWRLMRRVTRNVYLDASRVVAPNHGWSECRLKERLYRRARGQGTCMYGHPIHIAVVLLL